MPQTYLEEIKINNLPRLPLEGMIDLTYRCNNNCRHCWLRIPADAEKKKNELAFKEIRKIVEEARSMGCRRWSISGGEPMLRPDFPEIFDYLTRHFPSYGLNTNGTFINPKIARLMKRKGFKLIALYGATAEIHDHITRHPGSFDQTLRGFRYLREAGARFVVQLIPLRDNYHQFQDMVKLALSVSKLYRVGASWLYLSACADKGKNAEIKRQRLPPEEAIELDKPDLSYEESMSELTHTCQGVSNDKYIFAACINKKYSFHIDPYGKMTFCCYVKDPALRYDLRKGSFRDGWENFIPSLATKVMASGEYGKNCGSCEFKKDCRFCPVFGYLEHGDFSKKVEYLCEVTKANRKFKEAWKRNHRRYYQIADITVQVESDLPMNNNTFHPKFKPFEVKGPGNDTISIRHHFGLPDLSKRDLGKECYRKPPWAVYKKKDSWIYLGIAPRKRDKRLRQVAVFNRDHSRARIYSSDKRGTFLRGNIDSLTLFPTDQILLAHILADRGGCYMHSSGVNFNGDGLLFVGHSEAGKSTMATMLKGKAEILCDDRIIIRSQNAMLKGQNKGFRIYGTWNHGDVPDVSANSAPLKAIFFLEKATVNKYVVLKDKREIVRRLLSCMIMPFVTTAWWENSLAVIEKISLEVPCYTLHFDKSGRVVDLLERM